MKLGLFSPVYLFYGDEPLLIEEALALLKEKSGADVWNTEILEGEECSPVQAAASASTATFFGSRRLVVVKDIPWLGRAPKKTEEEDEPAPAGADAEPLLAYLAAPNPEAILALTLKGQPDKRRKLVKAIEKSGRLINCQPYRGEELFHWMEAEAKARGYVLPRPAMELLHLACGNQMAYLRQEIHKICTYCGDKKTIELADAEAIMSRGSLIHIFELMDQAAARNALKSVALFQTMTKEGEPPQKILAMLGRQFRDMLGVKELAGQGMKPREIAGLLGMHPFVAEKYYKSSRNFSSLELIRFMELLLNADIANKSGEGELHNLLETALMQICGSRG